EKELYGNIFKKTHISTQTTINNIFKNNLKEEVCLDISSLFTTMPPSYHELRVSLLKKHVELVQQSLEEHRAY
ncbi:hypothetical protein HN873_059539, partial [Arachis hypogaea]